MRASPAGMEINWRLHFGFIDQAHVSETAVGELVDDGTSQPAGQIVIDNSTEVGSQGGEEHYQIDVQLFVDCRFVGCRRNDYFGWKRNERTFNGH